MVSNFYLTGNQESITVPPILPTKRTLNRKLSKKELDKKIETKRENGWSNSIATNLGTFATQSYKGQQTQSARRSKPANQNKSLQNDSSQIKLKTMRLVNLKRDNIGHGIDKRKMRIMENETIDPRSMADRRSQDFIGLKQRKLEPIELASMKTHTLVSTIEPNANETTKNFDTEPYINKDTIDMHQTTPHVKNLGASDGVVMGDRSRITSSTHESQKGETPYEQQPDQS